MAEGAQQLQKELVAVETEAERLLLARRDMLDCDVARNRIRESLTAMRRQARTTSSSVPPLESAGGGARAAGGGGGGGCAVCGTYDGSTRTWMMFEGSDMFVRLPFHQLHSLLEQEEKKLESSMKVLESSVKEKALLLSDKGAISDKIGPSLMKSLVTLRDTGR